MFTIHSFSALPEQTGALPRAVEVIQGVLLGTVGTSIAVLAVAAIGFAMLQGRMPMRRGFQIMIGCFVLFGAPSIAQALLGFASQSAEGSNAMVAVSLPASPIPTKSVPVGPFDPYAGASVPQ